MYIMKHLIHALFGALVAVAVVTSATAQTAADSQKVLHIEPTSLRPVQTDALTGVNIDPIQTDMSNRPCARIKTRMNRMTKAEIADVEIKIIGGNAQVIRQMVADDGNGLIFEVITKAFKRLATWIVNILNWVLGAAFFLKQEAVWCRG